MKEAKRSYAKILPSDNNTVLCKGAFTLKLFGPF